ncbi:hypothetical protein SLE2022_181020 [Rubroshorea leprosula]
MEVEQSGPDNRPMTFDEVSMERSMNFIKALQELKNLRPQLYSAAKYCEKSYLHSEQKQMVLDNLKDYAVRALVNAVDHLGTVAYKLNDLLEQQTMDVSNMELKVSCIDQKLLTCRAYADKGGLKQQVMLAIIPKHHKHYILPNSVNKKVHFSPVTQTDARHTYFHTRSRLQPSGGPASKTLSWHLASETKSTLKGSTQSTASIDNPTTSGKTLEAFHLLGNDDSLSTKSSVVSGPASSALIQTFGVTQKDLLEGSKPITASRSFDNPRRENVHPTVRNKSVLSAFFVKPKTSKMKA